MAVVFRCRRCRFSLEYQRTDTFRLPYSLTSKMEFHRQGKRHCSAPIEFVVLHERSKHQSNLSSRNHPRSTQSISIGVIVTGCHRMGNNRLGKHCSATASPTSRTGCDQWSRTQMSHHDDEWQFTILCNGEGWRERWDHRREFFQWNSWVSFTLDTCQGDSGGPIMQFSEDKRRWVLTGIISYGDQCALRDYVGVFTRISVYVDWIKSVVGRDGLVIVEENSSPHLHANYIDILRVVILLYLKSIWCIIVLQRLFVIKNISYEFIFKLICCLQYLTSNEQKTNKQEREKQVIRKRSIKLQNIVVWFVGQYSWSIGCRVESDRWHWNSLYKGREIIV